MGVDFYLACGDCKEFIALHKWPVVEDAGRFLIHAHYPRGKYEGQVYAEDSPYPFAGLGTDFIRIFIASDDIFASLAANVPDQPYIHELTPIVQNFAATHKQHCIFLSCDLGDGHPWMPDQPDFADWLEIPGVFNDDNYLPRNLIDIKGLRTWEEVLIAMKEEFPFCYADAECVQDDIRAIRREFERRLIRKKQNFE